MSSSWHIQIPARQRAKLAYAKDAIPRLRFDRTAYPGFKTEADWKRRLSDVWGRSRVIGVVIEDDVLAHSTDHWFTTKKAALEYAKEFGLEVTNADAF